MSWWTAQWWERNAMLTGFSSVFVSSANCCCYLMLAMPKFSHMYALLPPRKYNFLSLFLLLSLAHIHVPFERWKSSATTMTSWVGSFPCLIFLTSERYRICSLLLSFSYRNGEIFSYIKEAQRSFPVHFSVDHGVVKVLDIHRRIKDKLKVRRLVQCSFVRESVNILHSCTLIWIN